MMVVMMVEDWEEVAMIILMLVKRTGKNDTTMAVMMLERLEQQMDVEQVLSLHNIVGARDGVR